MATFYHGTRRGFSKSGWVTPRTFNKGRATRAPLQHGCVARPDAERYVYVTTDIHLAWAYAYEAPGPGSPKVLQVEPHGSVTPDPEHSHAMEAYRVDGWAKVVAVIPLSEAPFTEAESRSGWDVYQKETP